MAEVIAISLEVDAGKSVQSVKSLEDAIADVQKTTNKSNVKEKFESLNRTIDESGASFDQLNASLNAYKNIALQAGRESAIGKEALKKAGEYKLKIDEIEMEVSNLAVKGQNMQGALQIGTSVMAGYQGFLGITALVGEENEALMETMVKLQAVMSVTQALEQIRLSTEKQSLAMKTLSNAKTKIATGLQWLYNGAIAGTTGGLKLLRVALISTGLGALVVLLGVIIASFDKWKDSVLNIINVALSPFIKVLQYLGVIDSDLEKQRKSNSEAYIKRLGKEREELDKNQAKEENRLKNEIALAKARGEDTSKLEKELLNIVSNGSKDRLRSLKQERHEVRKLAKEGWLEKSKALTEEINAEKILRANAKNDVKIFDANANTEQRDAWKKASETRKADRIKEHQDEMSLSKSFERDLQDLIIANEEDEDVRRLARLQLDQERALEDLRLKYGLETELEKELLIKQNTDLNELKQEIFLKNQEEGAKILEEILELEGEESPVIEKMRGEALTELEILRARLEAGLITEKEYAKKTQAIYDAKHLMRKAELDNAGSISSSLASLFAKNEKIQKANALVQIGIDTAKAISALVAQSNGNPMNLVTGGLAGFAQLATGLASIAGNVAKAKQLLSGGGGSITGGSGVTPPSFDTSTINSRSTNGDGSGDGGNTVPTNRVVLVESDLRMMQERRNNSEIISTI